MNRKPFHIIVVVIGLYLAAILQASVSPHLAVFHVPPDFLLLGIVFLALRAGRVGGAVIGFFDGLLMGAIAGANIQHYIAGRIIAGWITGFIGTMELDKSMFLTILVSVLVVICSQGILIVLAPSPSVTFTLEATIGTAVYNGVFAIPFYWLLKRVQDSNTR